MKLSDMAKRKAIHVILFGPSKSGKSLTAGKLANYGFKLHWLDLENGRTVLYQLPREAQENIDIIAIPDTKEFPVAAQTVPVIIKGRKTRICYEHGIVDCAICLKKDPNAFNVICANEFGPKDILVLDSTTQWSNSIMNHIGKDFNDLWRPEWEHYRTQGAMLDRVLTNVQNAPFHCIFISHEMEIKMEDGKNKLVPVAGTTNFARNTAKYFDEVIYCEVKNRKHVAASSTTYAPNILTGSRSGVVTENDPEQSLLRLFDPEMADALAAKKVEEAKGHLGAVQTQLGGMKK